MNKREVVIYASYKGFIKHYKLEFNKKSIDGSSNANITKAIGETVWGVCFELDIKGFENLKNHEKGYDELDVAIYNENYEILFPAKTLISSKICDKLPTKDYLDRIIAGARQHELPEVYIKNLVEKPTQN